MLSASAVSVKVVNDLLILHSSFLAQRFEVFVVYLNIHLAIIKITQVSRCAETKHLQLPHKIRKYHNVTNS